MEGRGAIGAWITVGVRRYPPDAIVGSGGAGDLGDGVDDAIALVLTLAVRRADGEASGGAMVVVDPRPLERGDPRLSIGDAADADHRTASLRPARRADLQAATLGSLDQA